MGVDLGNALQSLHLFHSLALLLQIRHLDGVPIPENLRIQSLKQRLIGILGGKILCSLLLTDIRGGGHVGDGLQLLLQCLGLRLRIGIIHIRQDLVLLLQILQQPVGVHRHQREGTHDEQTRHRDADGGKGHETVAEHIGQAFMGEIPEIVLSHGCSLPHSRPRCR